MSASLIRSVREKTQPVMVMRLAIFLLMVLPAHAILTTDHRVPSVTRMWASLLWMLCIAPFMVHVLLPARRRPPVPFLPIVGLLYGFYYSLPLISVVAYLPGSEIALSPASDYNAPVRIALMGWVALLLSYGVSGAFFRSRRGFSVDDWNQDVIRHWGFILLWGGLAMDVIRRVIHIPGAVRAIFVFAVTLSWFGGALLILLAIKGQLSRTETTRLILSILAAFVIQLGGGTTSALVFWAGVVFMSIWIGRGYLGGKWVIAMVVAALLMLAYRGVAEQYRRLAWVTQNLNTVERTTLAYELIKERVRTEGLGNAAIQGLEQSGRWGTIDIFAEVVRSTPNRIAHWNGYTYVSLVGVAIPRFLWPGKPTKLTGLEFGHRYGLLHEGDNNTSINLPYMVEFYVNFGSLGVLLGMLVVGAIYRFLRSLVNNPGQHSLMSVVGLVLLMPLWNIESDFSLTFGGLLLNGVALYTMMRFIQRRAAPRQIRVRARPRPLFPAPARHPFPARS